MLLVGKAVSGLEAAVPGALIPLRAEGWIFWVLEVPGELLQRDLGCSELLGWVCSASSLILPWKEPTEVWQGPRNVLNVLFHSSE